MLNLEDQQQLTLAIALTATYTTYTLVYASLPKSGSYIATPCIYHKCLSSGVYKWCLRCPCVGLHVPGAYVGCPYARNEFPSCRMFLPPLMCSQLHSPIGDAARVL